jgi:hypothetical protein
MQSCYLYVVCKFQETFVCKQLKSLKINNSSQHSNIQFEHVSTTKEENNWGQKTFFMSWKHALK